MFQTRAAYARALRQFDAARGEQVLIRNNTFDHSPSPSRGREIRAGGDCGVRANAQGGGSAPLLASLRRYASPGRGGPRVGIGVPALAVLLAGGRASPVSGRLSRAVRRVRAVQTPFARRMGRGP